MDNNNKEVLLSVQHLEQFFKMGKEQLKAVNDVSFDIYKGEVFGLVGESGCGKTTTGRSIIRLYDITGGSVYFKGQRIAAGTRSYRQAIEDEKKALKEDLAKLTTDAEKQARKQQSEKLINEMKQQIASAKNDHKNCNKIYSEKMVKEIEAKYEKILAEPNANKDELLKSKKEEITKAKNEKLSNKIQMIFQDPIASLDPRMTVKETIAEGLKIRGIKDKDYIDQEVYKVLDKVGLLRWTETAYWYC
jgi:oligopeptide transport system ATP-binding protein